MIKYSKKYTSPKGTINFNNVGIYDIFEEKFWLCEPESDKVVTDVSSFGCSNNIQNLKLKSIG